MEIKTWIGLEDINTLEMVSIFVSHWKNKEITWIT